MLIVNKMYKPEIGGVEVVTEQIAEFISEKYGRCDVLTFNDSRKKVVERFGGIRVIRLGSLLSSKSIRWSLKYKSELKKLCRKNDVIIYNYPSFQPELYNKKPNDTVKIVYYHADITRFGVLGNAYQAFIGKRFLSNADAIIISNPNMLKSSRILKAYEGKCHILPYGIDTSKFVFRNKNPREDIKAHFKADNCKLMLFVGRMARYKGLINIFKAMVLLDASYKLIIVSNDRLGQKEIKYIDKNDLDKRIEIHKGVENDALPGYYSACDVLLMPSTDRAEAFGLVAVEAMACGLPVVTTELSTGTSYHNLNKVTGRVIQPNNITQLKDSIEEICGGGSCYNKDDIRKRAGEFSIEKFRNNLLEIISRYEKT